MSEAEEKKTVDVNAPEKNWFVAKGKALIVKKGIVKSEGDPIFPKHVVGGEGMLTKLLNKGYLTNARPSTDS